jgi:hypothetical protein
MTVNLKDLGSFDFQSHPQTKNILILQIFFDNGYGISVITNNKNSKKSYNTVSYDVAVLKGVKNDNKLVIVPDMKYVDPDYDNYNSNEGVWKDLEFDKLYHKAKIISLL